MWYSIEFKCLLPPQEVNLFKTFIVQLVVKHIHRVYHQICQKRGWAACAVQCKWPPGAAEVVDRCQHFHLDVAQLVIVVLEAQFHLRASEFIFSWVKRILFVDLRMWIEHMLQCLGMRGCILLWWSTQIRLSREYTLKWVHANAFSMLMFEYIYTYAFTYHRVYNTVHILNLNVEFIDLTKWLSHLHSLECCRNSITLVKKSSVAESAVSFENTFSGG